MEPQKEKNRKKTFIDQTPKTLSISRNHNNMY